MREWVDQEVLPIIGHHYIERTFPRELIPQMGELGFFGANLPEKYGCAGLNNVAYGLIMQELERADSGLRSFVSVQGALVMYPIFAFGSEEQKREWLPRMASGESIGCFGLTEPDFGSNPGGMITRAVEDGDEWVLNGAKMWITNGSMADVAVIWAKIGDLDDVGSIPRLHRRDGARRLLRQRPEGEALPPGVRHFRTRPAGRAGAAGEPPPGQRGAQEPAEVPDAGALRHLVGGRRRRHGLLSRVGRVREEPRAVRRDADRADPDPAGSGSPTCSPRSRRRSFSASGSAA